MKILIFGAGAVGGTIASWVAPHHKELYLFDKPEVLSEIKKNGITTYPQIENASKKTTVHVNTISSLEETKEMDAVLLCVKNYSLSQVASLLKPHLKTNTLVVGFQNGIENQRILPNHFEHILYGIVCYNAWLDSPSTLGYQKKGPLVLGNLNNQITSEMKKLCGILNRGVPTQITKHFQDAAHTKMVVNLTNSFTTLVGHHFEKKEEEKLFQKILTNLTSEGVRIVRRAGFKEVRMGGMPSWKLMTLAAKLPSILTRRAFRKNMKKMVVSSMEQDILVHGRTSSEIESLNGYFVRLAHQKEIKAPYNEAIYNLCKERFSNPGFKTMKIEEVWREIQKSSLS